VGGPRRAEFLLEGGCGRTPLTFNVDELDELAAGPQSELVGFRLLASAVAARSAGCASEALRAARLSADVWQGLETPYLVAQAHLEEAVIHRQLRRRSQAAASFRQAYQLATEIGAQGLARHVSAESELLGVTLSSETRPLPRVPKPRTADNFGLTRRESEVLRLVAIGRSNQQIASALFLSPSTVGVHVSNILAKMNVSSRTEAGAVAHRLHLAEEPG